MSLDVNQCSTHINGRAILEAVSFTAQPGEPLAIIGPSGAGKTTLLRCIAGLQPYSGHITLNHQKLDNLPPEKRHIGLVDQRLNLFPHLTVFENVAYPLRLRRNQTGQTKTAITTAVHALLKEFQITDLAQRYPHEISGGEQQRVALARALIYQPQLLLLDEPFASLDAIRKYDIVHWFRQTVAHQSIPILFVTHDIREAQALANQALVLINGQVVAHGPWSTLTKNSHSQVQQLLTQQL